jgi:Ca2+-binding RTX toxin-like protein
MANYVQFGTGISLFDAFNGDGSGGDRPFSGSILYINATEIGVLNKDGSKTFMTGTDLVWDPDTLQLLGGTITRMVHYTNGQFTDEVTGITTPATLLNQLGAGSNYFQSVLFDQGNDVLDARNRANNAVLPVSLDGGEGDDLIYGGAGNDKLKGGNGADVVNGRGGGDTIYGDQGFDGLFDGNDRLNGDDGDDRLIGDGGNDRLAGGNGNDLLMGGTGNDAIMGGADTDTAVFRHAFSDLTITRTANGFTVTSGDGSDSLTGMERIGADDGIYEFNSASGTWTRILTAAGVSLVDPSRVIRGTAQADVIDNAVTSPETPTVVYGLDGDDTITGSGYSDLIFGGDGNDVIYGWVGDGLSDQDSDRIYGGTGNDRIFGVTGNDRLDGGTGNDLLVGGILFGETRNALGATQLDQDKLFGGSGADQLAGGFGADQIDGGTGTDTAIYASSFSELTITRTATGFSVKAPNGTDALVSVERIAADDGIYTWNGSSNTWVKSSSTAGVALIDPSQVVRGTNGADSLSLDDGTKTIAYGLDGDDVVRGNSLGGPELVFGGNGDDDISTNSGRLYGDAGNDTLTLFFGGTLDGGAGDDILTTNVDSGAFRGGAGNDTLNAGGGNDQLSGGTGSDTFNFLYVKTTGFGGRPIEQRWGTDVITDFEVGIDKLAFSYNVTVPGGSTTEFLSLTAEGYLITSGLDTTSSILLKGLTTPGLTLGDLLG